MKTTFSQSKAKEVLLNLDLLIGKTNDRREQLTLRIIKIWYQKWFSTSQTEALYSTWASKWNVLLGHGPYAFPFPEVVLEKKNTSQDPKAMLAIDGEAYPFKDVVITPVAKKFSHRGTVVQKSQLFTSFPDSLDPDESLVVVTIRDKSDFLLPSSKVRIKR